MIFENKAFKYTLWALVVVISMYYFRQLNFITSTLRTILVIVIIPLILASFFYYILRPLVRFLVNHKINRSLAVVGVFLLVAGIISGLSIFVGRAVVTDFRNFYQTISKYIQQAPENVKQLINQQESINFSFSNLEDNILNSSQVIFQTLRTFMSQWVSSLTEAGTIIILIPVIVFFLLKDDEKIFQSFFKLIPKKYQGKLKKVTTEIDELLQTYFLSQLIVAGFLGLLTYIGYLIIDIPNALILAIFSMIFSIIPLLGPAIGLIPAIFIAWTVDPMMVLKVLIVLLITQQLEGNVVRPKIMGTRLDMHPLLIIFLVILAVSLFGFMGAFFVIPFYGVFRIIMRSYFNLPEKEE